MINTRTNNLRVFLNNGFLIKPQLYEKKAKFVDKRGFLLIQFQKMVSALATTHLCNCISSVLLSLRVLCSYKEIIIAIKRFE